MCGLFLEQTKGIKGPNPKVLKLEISKKAMIKSFKQRSTLPHRACWCHVAVLPSP
jgi:hypothetical protein